MRIRFVVLGILLIAAFGTTACANSGDVESLPTVPLVPSIVATATPITAQNRTPQIAVTPTPTTVSPPTAGMVTPTVSQTLTSAQFDEAFAVFVELLNWIDIYCNSRIYQTVSSSRVPTDLRLLNGTDGWYLTLSQIKRLSPDRIPWPEAIANEPGIWIEPETGLAGAHDELFSDCYDADRFGRGILDLQDELFEASLEEIHEVVPGDVTQVVWLEEDRLLLEVFGTEDPLAAILTSVIPEAHYFLLALDSGQWKATNVTEALEPDSDDCPAVWFDSSPESGLWIVRWCDWASRSEVYHYDFVSLELIDKLEADAGPLLFSVATSLSHPSVWIQESRNNGLDTILRQISPELPGKTIELEGSINGLAVSPDGNSLVFLRPVFLSDGLLVEHAAVRWQLITIDLASLEETTLIAGFQGSGWRLHWVDNGSRILMLSTDGIGLNSIVIDLESGLASTFVSGRSPSDVSVDGSRIISSARADGFLQFRSISQVDGP